MNKQIEQNPLLSAAKQYADEKKVSIKTIKSLRGETQLYYAFIAGAAWQKEQIKKQISQYE